MTYDLLKLAEECALFFNTNRSESAKRTMRAVAAALREAIEDGPHGELCSSRDGFMIFGHKCDCWKRAALEGK